jgi:hypothetical protein
MHAFAACVIRFRYAIIAAIIGMTAATGWFLKDLKVNPDIVSYFPDDDPVVRAFKAIGRDYGGTSIAMVAVEEDSSVFNPRTLGLIRDLTGEFRLMPEVSYVTSLTNIMDIKNSDAGLEIGRLIDEFAIPSDRDSLAMLQRYALSRERYAGRIVSADAKTTLIVCRLRQDADQMKAVKALKAIVEKKKPAGKIYYAGFPFQMLNINTIVFNDLLSLIPICIIVVIITLAASFRSVRGVFLPLITVLISAVWTMGFMSMFSIPITVISDIIPVILMAVGSAYGIHVVSKYYECAPQFRTRRELSRHMLGEVGLPVFLAGLTTVIGFLSFLFSSYLTLIRDFGIFSSLGIAFALIIALTLVPALLSFWPPPRNAAASGRAETRSKFLERVGIFICKRTGLVIGCGAIIMAICITGIPRVERKATILDYFKEGTPIRKAEHVLRERFGGSTPIQVLVKGDINDPAVLSLMREMEEFLKTQENVANPQSIADVIEEMNDVMGEGKRVPDRRDKVRNLRFLIDGEDIISQMVNADNTEAVIQATVSNVNTRLVRTLVRDIDAWIRGHASSTVSFEQTGLHYIYRNLDESIFWSLIQSLTFSIVLIFLCVVFLMRSFVRGLIGLIPLGFALAVIFGFMGWAGYPLDVVTVIIGSVAIGIGVDYTIHFTNRFIREYQATGDAQASVRTALATTGTAILINAVTVSMGFLVLLFADLVPLQQFGILVAIAMAASSLASITVLPAALLYLYSPGNRRAGRTGPGGRSAG